MQRPLVWVGTAYIAGCIWAVLHFHILLLLTCIAVIYLIIMQKYSERLTGKYRQSILKNWLFYMLPVFCLSGFVRCSHENIYPCERLFETEQKVNVTFVGKVVNIEEKEKSIAVTVDAEVEGEFQDVGLLLHTKKEGPIFEVGDRITGHGELKQLERAMNPGQFDFASYYHAKGIDYIIWADDIERLSKTFSYKVVLSRLKKYWIETYEKYLPRQDLGVMNALLMGDKQLLDETIKDTYSQAGVIHILAISGLHISIVGMGIYELLRRLGAGIKKSALTAAFIVLSYGVMTGLSSSTERAVIMFLIRMGALYIGTSYDMLSALFLAAIIVFVKRPLMVAQAGVQFSFAAVLSIVILFPAIKNLFPVQHRKSVKKRRRIHLPLDLQEEQQHRLKETLKKQFEALKEDLSLPSFRECVQSMKSINFMDIAGVSLAITIGTLPLSIFYYGRVPLVSVFLNLVILSVVELLVPLGFIAGLSGFFSVTVAKFLCGSIRLLLAVNDTICKSAVKIPLAIWRTGEPPLAWIILSYLFIGLFIFFSYHYEQFKKLFPCQKNLMCILMVSLFILIPYRRLMPVIVFLDIGQGDCIFMRTDRGTTYLIDAGSSDVDEIGKYRIEPLLAYYGEEKIDYACVSHGDEDHISGIRELLMHRTIKHLVLTEVSKEDRACQKLIELARQINIPISFVKAGDRWGSDDWPFECLYPTKTNEISGENDKNDCSMVLKINAKGTYFLMTGDISEVTEEKLQGKDLKNVDILKVAHHGSKTSSNASFLKKIGAKIAVISCGKNNRYGHPAKETIERLKDRHMQIKNTAADGAIIMLWKNGRWQIK